MEINVIIQVLIACLYKKEDEEFSIWFPYIFESNGLIDKMNNCYKIIENSQLNSRTYIFRYTFSIGVIKVTNKSKILYVCYILFAACIITFSQTCIPSRKFHIPVVRYLNFFRNFQCKRLLIVFHCVEDLLPVSPLRKLIFQRT